MKVIKLLLCFILILCCIRTFAQNKPKSAAEIRKEMAEIRRNTDWSNSAKAAESQKKIEELSKQLMVAGKAQQQQASGVEPDSARLKAEAEYKMQLWHQMMEGVAQGEEGDILLAKPIRDQIVEAYKNDESPKIKNPEYYQEQTYLCIDLSVPTIQRIIDQMENFKGIKILLITCSKNPVQVDLEDLLRKARGYPLEQLYIINFKQFVTSIPASLGQFSALKTLSLINNAINEMPAELEQLKSLEKLYVDINPVSTLLPVVTSLDHLDTLGVAKTNISENEIGQIQSLLPHCNILLK
jgi:Leucine-rich repeat (LRR) protein